MALKFGTSAEITRARFYIEAKCRASLWWFHGTTDSLLLSHDDLRVAYVLCISYFSIDYDNDDDTSILNERHGSAAARFDVSIGVVADGNGKSIDCNYREHLAGNGFLYPHMRAIRGVSAVREMNQTHDNLLCTYVQFLFREKRLIPIRVRRKRFLCLRLNRVVRVQRQQSAPRRLRLDR